MNKQIFSRISFLIGLTMLLVIASQVYRTVKDYQVNKQHFINDIQNALDLSVEAYYADRAKDDFFVFSITDDDTLSMTATSGLSYTTKSGKFDSTWHVTTSAKIDTISETKAFGYSYAWSDSNFTTIRKHFNSDSILEIDEQIIHPAIVDSTLPLPHNKKEIGLFAHKIMVSISEDQIDLDKLLQIFEKELSRKRYDIGFQLVYEKGNESSEKETHTNPYPLQTVSKSTYLPENESIRLFFANASLAILKNGILDLLISIGIVLAVMSSLLYLYRIIRSQKQLAMIKDDLISNITHEFKTPIATISSAIEGISLFNEANDKEKTQRYLGISSNQLKKLNLMVENLLETATIDSGEIDVTLEEVDAVALTLTVVKNYQLLLEDKQLDVEILPGSLWCKLDSFHIENVLSNLIDNAIKYGGTHISVTLTAENGRPVWQVSDNGGNIDKIHREMIFEKLYRIPQGNQHDVKGFGIGLYYTKAIVEKHGGTISLEVKPNHTTFTIRL